MQQQNAAPTIQNLREQGLSALAIACKSANCNHVGWVYFDRLDFDEETPVAAIASQSRFRCERCRGREVAIGSDGRARSRR
jgi:cobalamin biosynthesis Mg chelatase CobN